MDYFGFNSPRDMVLDQLQKSNLKSKDAAKVFWNTMTLYSKTKFG
jgi:hypothetical protein